MKLDNRRLKLEIQILPAFIVLTRRSRHSVRITNLSDPAETYTV